MKLKGKVALVTGGTSGIGLAIAGRLRERGARVVACGLPEHPALGSRADRVLYGDITDAAFREHMVSVAIAEFGRVDVLVNSAGVGIYAPASESPGGLVRRMFDINVIAAMEMAMLAREPMRRSGGGTIVNLGSIGGMVALPWSTMYCASKSAVHALNEGLYRELRGEGIHVMLVVPGIVRTPFRRHVLAGEAPEGVMRIRYMISPEALAAAVVSGIERKRRRVLLPWPGYVFAALNALFPSIIDWYCDRKLAGRAAGSRAARAGSRPLRSDSLQ